MVSEQHVGQQFRSKRVRAGLYLTPDGRHAVEKFEGYGLNEWRLHSHSGSEFSGLGEWHQSYATKAEAVAAAARCTIPDGDH